MKRTLNRQIFTHNFGPFRGVHQGYDPLVSRDDLIFDSGNLSYRNNAGEQVSGSELQTAGSDILLGALQGATGLYLFAFGDQLQIGEDI